MEILAERIQMLSLQMVPFIMAVVFHEYAHGKIAHYWGDPTAKAEGRLTLNPLPHLDPVGTLLFPVINMLTGMNLLFGWAKPVPINPVRFRNYRKGVFWVAVGGPAMNFFLAIVSAVCFCTLYRFVPESFYLHEPLVKMSLVSVSLNYALGIFNLIPLPPLDGSKIVDAFLPYEASKKYQSIAQYSFYIFLALLFTGAFSILHYPIEFCTQMTLGLVAKAFGL